MKKKHDGQKDEHIEEDFKIQQRELDVKDEDKKEKVAEESDICLKLILLVDVEMKEHAETMDIDALKMDDVFGDIMTD